MSAAILQRTLTRLTLQLTPLTPIHIGDGTDLRPDEYLLKDDCLCRFDPAEAMRLMSPAERTRFQSALDSANLKDVGTILRKAGERCIAERVPISAASRRELTDAMTNPERSGAVKPFIRSGGRPYIPGSSLKGAFRTALASARLPREKNPADAWTHEAAMQAALGIDPNDTVTDPLRFLHVSDANLPEAATLIDRAEVFHPRKPEAKRMQMHYERTQSLIEGSDKPAFEVVVTIDDRAANLEYVPGRFNKKLLLSDIRRFHVKIFNKEMSGFFDSMKAKFFQTLRSYVAPDGRAPVQQSSYDPNFLLLRLGRFGHFESKSLDDVRRGYFPQRKGNKLGAPDEWGHTRTVAWDRSGNPLPFGWVVGWVVKEEQL